MRRPMGVSEAEWEKTLVNAKALYLLTLVKDSPPVSYVDEEDDSGECAWCHERSYLPHRDDCLYKQIVDYLTP